MSLVKSLGPFLCKPTPNSMGFWFAFGPNSEISNPNIQIEIRDMSQVKLQLISLSRLEGKNPFNVYIGETTPNLTPDTSFQYSILINQNVFLPEGISATDLQFKTLPTDSNADLKFALMSCHGIEAWESDHSRDPDRAWDMWKRFDAELSKGSDCRFLILGGDQVYMDDTFGESLKKFYHTKPDEMNETIWQTYFKHWSHPTYRKVMAKLPALLMWDDHDLIDGWGSRNEQMSDTSGKWIEYGKIQSQAFQMMQGSRNPGVIDEKSGFSFKISCAGQTFLGLDLRSSRKMIDHKSSEMMSSEHRNCIDTAIEQIAQDESKSIFLISPVTAARMGTSIERAIGKFANLLWNAASKLSYESSRTRASLWFFIWSIFYFLLHFEISFLPGFVQTAGLILALGITFICTRNLNKYFDRSPRKYLWGIAGLGLFLSYRLFDIANSVELEPGRELIQATKEKVIPAFIRMFPEWGIGYFIGGLVPFVLLIYDFEKIESRKIATKLAFVLLVLAIPFNWWLSLPIQKFNSETAISILSVVTFGVFTILTYIMVVLESTGAIDNVAGLDDDVRDGWSSENNSKDLGWLLNWILKLETNSKRVTLLCGDIHTGGISEISVKSGSMTARVPQITSSPISYPPMPHLVEKLTSGSQPDKMTVNESIESESSNLFYRSERNFAFVSSNKIGKINCDFFYEDLADPVRISIRS